MLTALEKFYSGEKYWYKSNPAIIIIYLLYLVYLRLADKNDHTVFILECPQCGISFITKNSNLDRSDVLCPFGCRQENKKSKARERSKRYYQKPDKKKIKQKLNKARSLTPSPNNKPEQKTSVKSPITPILVYAKLLLQAILKKADLQPQEIAQIQKILRSRGLSFYQKLVHSFNYG